MNSNTIKTAFQAAGIRVRVADQGPKFRVCTLGDTAFDQAAATAVAISLGLTDSLARLGGQFNQLHERVGYKPGAIRRV